MLEHGTFELKLHGRVLHSFPRGSFNRPGLLRYRQALLLAAAKLSGWILYEHAGNEAALTSEALPELIETYRQAEENGCIGIACDVGPLFRDLIQAQALGKLQIPLLLSDKASEIEPFISGL
ncbi:hypothetical protein [Bowmanella denitrificans]|uniref:hypothetical protein n=1 Tax=Bowmanella denitrificans TaxID=366582 RepID=UPI000C9C5091|nr:hypothetical protein [Bowmanella denitrificans]